MLYFLSEKEKKIVSLGVNMQNKTKKVFYPMNVTRKNLFS